MRVKWRSHVPVDDALRVHVREPRQDAPQDLPGLLLCHWACLQRLLQRPRAVLHLYVQQLFGLALLHTITRALRGAAKTRNQNAVSARAMHICWAICNHSGIWLLTSPDGCDRPGCVSESTTLPLPLAAARSKMPMLESPLGDVALSVTGERRSHMPVESKTSCMHTRDQSTSSTSSHAGKDRTLNWVLCTRKL